MNRCPVSRLTPTVSAALALCVCASLLPHVSAQTIIGPGNIAVDAQDNAAPMIVVDLANAQTLAAGQWSATNFNYQFSTSVSGSAAGTIAPMLFTSPSANVYTPIALGGAVGYTSPTAFLTNQPFGGTSTFTLPSQTTVYAGLYYERTAPFSGSNNMAIGFANSGSSFLRYGGANAPSVGSPISGGTPGTFPRAYDFSVTVEAVPEPSLGLLAVGGVVVGCWRFTRPRIRAVSTGPETRRTRRG